MTSMISIVDTTAAYYSTNNLFKVVVSDHEDNVVLLNGQKAVKYLQDTILSGYINSVSSGKDSGIMPPGVRIVGPNYVVFERPPTYQNIFYNIDKVHSGMTEDNVHVYRVALPWQIYVASFNKDYYVTEVAMYFSPVCLTSKDQPVYLPPIPNFYTNGSLCRPMFADMTDVERYPKNLSGVVACAYDWIWNNGTNNDLNEAVVHVNLQLASKGEEQYNSTIFSKMDKDIYRSMFINPYGVVMYHSSQVSAILKSWEASTLEEVMNYQWPSPSADKHFSQIYYHSPSTDITEHSNYYNWLSDWAAEYYDGESQEDIEYMIDNSEYDSDAYYEYVASNHLSPTPIEFKTISLQDALYSFIAENSSPNLKSTFSSYVAKAFEYSQSSSQQSV